jgi:hypothetical protein
VPAFAACSACLNHQRFPAADVHCRYVTDEVRPHSLVLIDELGKGTEVVWGTVMTSAMIKHLVASGARSVFCSGMLQNRIETAKLDTAQAPAACVLRRS